MISRLAVVFFALNVFSVCCAQDLENGASRVAGTLDSDRELEFNVYVPKGYKSAVPAGLLVYVSPIDSGAIPESWQGVFDKRNMIWVGVNGSGNTKPDRQRIAEAKLSRSFILKDHEIDPERTYIAGMSGGGQISSITASLYPELFRGGIFLCGVNPWSESDVDPWVKNPPENIDAIRQNRYVFVSGTEDFKLAATARVYRTYKKAGIDNSRLIVIDGMGHELPDARTFSTALQFLDGL
jgi:predicted esterase